MTNTPLINTWPWNRDRRWIGTCTGTFLSLYFFLLLCHIQQCPELLPDSLLRDYSWWGSCGVLDIELGARQVTYSQYYTWICFSPLKIWQWGSCYLLESPLEEELSLSLPHFLLGLKLQWSMVHFLERSFIFCLDMCGKASLLILSIAASER